MKVKVNIKLLPNGQGKSEKEREINKTLELSDIDDFITFNDLFNQLDLKTKQELDNRMVSYYDE